MGIHGDLIDSTMLNTDSVGGAGLTEAVACTAFGEAVVPDGSGGWTVGGDHTSTLGSRYGYAGGWGYESGLLSLDGVNPDLPAISLQHLGWRWYDPAIGRFVQRDPIGLGGGINVYAYGENQPTAAVDPAGLMFRDIVDEIWWFKEISDAVKKYGKQKVIGAVKEKGIPRALARRLVAKAMRLFPLLAACVYMYPYIEDAVTWRPPSPSSPVPRAGEWRKWLW